MVDIEKVKPEIVERLKVLDPERIILFGSYANGQAREDSDIDLFLVMKEAEDNVEAKALFFLRDLMKKYKVGFDVLAERKHFLAKRIDPFYSVNIMQQGKLLYGK